MTQSDYLDLQNFVERPGFKPTSFKVTPVITGWTKFECVVAGPTYATSSRPAFEVWERDVPNWLVERMMAMLVTKMYHKK